MHTNHSTHAPLPTTTAVAVIGAGTMGAGIAQVAASHGHPVQLFDLNPEALQRGLDQIATGLAGQVKRGKLNETQRTAILARLNPTSSLAALGDCGLVIEAVVEDLAIKRRLLADLEATCAADCILASNTSSISITALGAEMQHPERLVGMHFFNPAPVMKLVEVVSGLATAPATAAQVHATATAWGKQAVLARSTPGFIVNRVARPFYAEGLRLLEEGAAEVAQIDQLLREAGGFRMGPFELMDLIGHDVNYAVTCSVYNAYYQDPRFTPSLTQQALVEAGRLGRKSGQGFYDYRQGSATAAAAELPTTTDAAVTPCTHLSVYGDLGVAEALIARAEACGIRVQRHPAASTAMLTQAGAGWISTGSVRLMLSDGRSASERAAITGHCDLVLFDLALDYATTPRLALAAADQCSAAARADALGLLAALTIAPTLIDDVPGMVLLRTVAMLANEAADAVLQGVCSASDADRAMQGGVNYPRGPLAWADQIGISALFTCLQHLQQSYGEDRYRPSALLRRLHFSGRSFHA